MLTSILSVMILLLSYSIANVDYTDEVLVYNESVTESRSFYIASGDYDDVKREDWLLDIRYPVDDYANTSSTWGSRYVRDCPRCSGYHKGVDFTPGRGSPVYAAMDGVVTQVKNSGEYGMHVVITHEIYEDLVYTTVYAHLQVSNVTNRLQLDNNIVKGDILGYVGNTGLSTGPHLHFEIRKNGVHINPLPFLDHNMAS